MAKKECILPAMGEGIIEATITRWFVKEGDTIVKDEPLLEVATDKVDSEVPAAASGVVTRLIYHEGEIPKVGEVIAFIDDGEPEDTDERLLEIEKAKEERQLKKPSVSNLRKPKNPIPVAQTDPLAPELTPFIRFLARDRGIGPDELINIRGTGINGRITRDDLNNYIRNGRVYRAEQLPLSYDEQHTKEASVSAGEAPTAGEGEEVVPMSRTRMLIAEHMIRSKHTSPHVTSMVEIDVTELVRWRESHKHSFREKYGAKLTYTPIIVQAVVKALKLFPDINISVTGNFIIRKEYIHIGVATALPDGNLIVPVIKNADQRNFANLAITLSDLAERARQGKLEPSEIKGGTFTITNMGQYDNISGTPIINQPEVAILAVGAIKKKPGVVKLNGQDTIGIRDILILSLTYDHRVVDGALGGSFVKMIGEKLTQELPEF